MYYDFHEWIVMISMINKQLKESFSSKHCYAGQKIDVTLIEISWSPKKMLTDSRRSLHGELLSAHTNGNVSIL
jgi:hypothetical protein